MEISEEFKEYLIDQFEQQKPECLDAIKKYDNKNNVRYLEQAIMSDQFVMIAVRYDLQEKRFVELSTNVINKKGKSEFVAINLFEPASLSA